ncbi:hypothetical protein SSX86_026390 [Deinandra increscens subsp. villosa]|uniref:non-specific serine/threonine protein kinase n=1 Tax=Deinandra increscens subsp. villosa TaxID=3103831 RepID=A0AAP0CI16_9ASTR
MRGSLISLLRLLAVIPAAFGSFPISPPSSTNSDSSVPDQIQLPPPLPAKINCTPKQDAILVAAPDGTLYQLDISSGQILWSFPSGTPIYDAHQALNLEDDGHNSSRQHNKFYIDCGDDWQLYIHGLSSKAEKLPFDVEELIRRTPHVSVDGVLTGSKKTTVFLVDPQTGRVIYTFKSDGGPNSEESSIVLKKDAEKWKEPTTFDFEPVGQTQLLYIKRFDYKLTYSSTTTGNVLWSLMFADFEASRQCRGSNNFFGGIKGDEQLQEFCQSNPPVYRARDARELEIIFLVNNLKISLHGREMFALPSPDDDISSLSAPVSLPKPFIVNPEIPHQIVPYMPPLNPQDSYGVHTKNASIIPENIASIHVWLHGFLVASLSCKTATSKKKKARKSTGSRLDANSEKATLNGFQYVETGERKIGKLVVSNKEIGKGSNGTIVLEGVYDARPVAVKRIVKLHHNVALKEIQNLIVSDHHPNIVRWYGVEYDQDFVYIALERCICSLHDLILSQNNSTVELQLSLEVFKDFKLWKPNGYPSPELLRVMRDTVTGLAHLHELGIIHRDLKPQNVLIRKDSSSINAKVSDMGISKRLPADMSCLTKSATGYGSSGWQAPEQLRNERQTRALDLFAFGCLLFFCITGGRHPFGDMLERDLNIVNDRKDLFLVDNIPEAFHLISNLLHPDPEFRFRKCHLEFHAYKLFNNFPSVSAGSTTKSPQFSLCKWTSTDDKNSSLEKENIEEDEQLKENLSSRESGRMRGSLISLLRLLAVIPAAFGSFPISPPSSTNSDSSVPDQIQLPPPLPAKINCTPKQDAILVAAPDGTLYQLDISSGQILWSFPSGTPIYDAHQALNLEDDGHNSSRQHNKFYIDCGDDWQLYIHGLSSKAEKLPFDVEELIRRTPHVSVDGVLTGSKKTTVFLVDPQTGRVIYTFKSDGGPNSEESSIVLKEDAEKWKEPTTFDFEPVGQTQLLYIKRFDYKLTYSSTTTGNVLWSLMFADFEASRQCRGSNNFFGGIKGDEQLQEFCQSNPPVYRARDARELEIIFLVNNLKISLHGSEMFALPSPDDDISSLSAPVSLPKPFIVNPEIPHQIVPYMPPLNSQDSYDVHTKNTSIIPENIASIHVWLHGFLVASLSFIIALIFYFWNFWRGKQTKSKEFINNTKVQNSTSKKKKARKSTGSRLDANSEKATMNGFQYVETGERKIGKLVVSNKEIGKGSNGTIVLEGVYDARPVAVKRIVKLHHNVALKEIQNLIVSDHHPNIVRWYGVEYDQDFVYIALERCICSLHDLILSQNNSTVELQLSLEVFKDFKLWKPNGYPSPELLRVMRDTVTGLAHLHELGIIHRDLKPQNVLIRKDSSSINAKVSDMGISKRLPADMSCLTKSATGYGSSGWQAPEQLRNERQTRALDLFAFGCLLFFCITGGRHPFGDMLERDLNIVNDRKDLFLVDNIPEAFHLISNLLHPDPEFRPKAAEVPHHPLFWDPEMRLSFLRDASDRVELEDRETDSDLLKALENIGAVALNGKWDEKLDNTLLSDIGRYRKYKYDSVRDLLRVIRNKLNHYRELPKDIRDVLGAVPTGFESYFSSRFPKLVMEVYKVLQNYCGEEEFLHKYFKRA